MRGFENVLIASTFALSRVVPVHSYSSMQKNNRVTLGDIFRESGSALYCGCLTYSQCVSEASVFLLKDTLTEQMAFTKNRTCNLLSYVERPFTRVSV